MQLEAAGHDVAWCGDWLADPGDEAVLELPRKRGAFSSRWTKTSASWPLFADYGTAALFDWLALLPASKLPLVPECSRCEVRNSKPARSQRQVQDSCVSGCPRRRIVGLWTAERSA
jgi:hypothetical protein